MCDRSSRDAPANSILIITINGSEQKYGTKPQERCERLRNLLGALVPDDLPPTACKGEQMQETLADFGLSLSPNPLPWTSNASERFIPSVS